MAPERKRPTRSQLYQHLLVEKAFSHEMMETFPNEDSIYKKLNPFDYNEEILVLEDQLKERFWEIINEHLTPRQLEIVKLLKEGATQQEAARKLGVNQSSITKCLSSETLLYFKDKKITIKNIFDEWSEFSYEIKKMDLICLNEDDDSLSKTHIKDVMCSGLKQLISITTSSGKTIRASKDHRFMTNAGWAKLEDVINNNLKLKTKAGKQIQLEDIESYKIDGEEITYDIEVAGPYHNFVANGIITHNSINGNVDYSNKVNGGKASYGGICKKLARVVDKDPVIKEILQKISDLRNDTWI